MKFIYEEVKKDEQLTLDDVKEDQFFICADGYLCQKIDENAYNTIADEEGNPSCRNLDCDYNMPINRILPCVEKIEF
jgi:hypothetical protein